MMMPIKSPCEESAASVAPGAVRAMQRALGLDCDDSRFQHGIHRRDSRQRSIARFADCSSCIGDGHSMGGRVLRPSACIAAAIGRFSWRSLWPPQSLPLRRSAVCNWIVLVRPRHLNHFPHRRARSSRDRSGVSWSREAWPLSAPLIQRTSAGGPSAPGPASRRSLQLSGRSWADGWWKMRRGVGSSSSIFQSRSS